MAIAFINQANSSANYAGGPFTSGSTSPPVSVTQGNFLICMALGAGGINSVSDGLGSIWTVGAIAGFTFFAWAIAKATNANTTFTVNFPSSSGVYLMVLQYSGIDKKIPIDAITSGNTGTGTSVSGNPISTRWPNEVIISTLSHGGTTPTAGAGFTIRSNPVLSVMMEDDIVTTVQTNLVPTASSSGSASWAFGSLSIAGAGQNPASKGAGLLLGVG